MKRTSLILVMVLSLGFSLMAQKYSNEFLAIGAGARAQGMGNSSVASSSDAYSPYWNPAGMAGVESNMQLAFMHAEWFAGVGNYDYLSLVYPIYSEKKDKRRAFGISAIRFGVDDIPNTLSLYADDGTVDYNNITSFSSADYAFLLSYAQDYWMGDNRKLFIGGNAKVIYRNIGSFAKAVGFGFDLGAQFHLKNVSFGLTAKDLTNTFNAWNFSFTEEEKETLAITNNEIPINSLEVTRPWFILGSAYHKRFGKFGMLTELDFRLTTDGKRNTLVSSSAVSLDPNVGLEFDYNEMVYLRAGLNNFQQEKDLGLKEKWTMQPTLGIGLSFKIIKVDYAFTDISNTSQQTYSHVISLLLDMDFSKFGKTIKNNK